MGFVVEAGRSGEYKKPLLFYRSQNLEGFNLSSCSSSKGSKTNCSNVVTNCKPSGSILICQFGIFSRGPSSQSFQRRGGGDNESQRTSCPWSKVYFASRDKETRPCISIMEAYSFLAFSSATSITPCHLSCVSLPSSPAMSPPACTPVRVRRLPNLLIPSANFIPVSCLEACPVRGSRVVFASYRDGLGQANFFPMMRVPSSCFIRTLVHIKRVRYERKPFGISLKDIRNVGLPSSKLGSDVSPPSEHISSNGIQDSIESLQYTFLEATAPAHHSEAACATLPPSFSALLSDSCTEPSSNYGSMQYTYPKVATLAHDSALSSHTCALACQYFRSSLMLLHQGKTRSLIFGDNVQMAEPVTMPLPCDPSFQIRVLFQLFFANISCLNHFVFCHLLAGLHDRFFFQWSVNFLYFQIALLELNMHHL
ncbi:hypothetical protein NC653_034997 [Populus alba x Populus x berolinensis]|uniref:Uncharacterized protein n=1 Tax=Populus alba x Populus x berolinensis TaxID=444605 RepID=A0AAD6LNS7_9ROSI|nr:hypothetical protein NC653_034997 [Populus alba x Populus x berolinensis]